jgi:methylated-DNA-protein-cysteine methyltransferase-like protein
MNFYTAVYKIVKTIPSGKVMTYGQIATMISSPRAARVVGFALRAGLDKNIPWQRVINSQGMISIVNPRATKQLQAALLRQDGVKVILKQGNYYIGLNKYLYIPKNKV